MEADVFGAVKIDLPPHQAKPARTAAEGGLALAHAGSARAEAEEAREQAEQSELRLRAFVERCPECVSVLSPDGTVLQINEAGLRLVDAESPEQVLGKSMFDFIAPPDRERYRAMHERVCAGATERQEFELMGLKGTARPVETHAAPVLEVSRGGCLHLAITRDLSERRQADLVSRWLSAIVESSDDAIISKDLNGTIMTWNQGAERIFGYTAAEIVGQPVVVLIPPERLDEEPGILARIRRGERIDHYETVRQRKDGTLVDISLSVSPVKDASGRVVGASKIARDISARKRAEAQLRQATHELTRMNEELERRVSERTASLREAVAQMEEFSYTVSHDLRAPARSMRSYAKIVLEDYGQQLPPEAQDYLERIVRGGERMDRLIQDVLTYSRFSRRELELRPVSLDKLVPDILQQYPDMQAPRAEVVLRTPLLSVQAHEPSLAQAISNLLTNAVKFMPPGERPRIVIRTEGRGSRVRLWVEDNGIGIKPKHQHRIFGMFERLPSAAQYEGTGVGLAIVRKVAEKMNGTVGVESDGMTGSRFWLELAAAP